ncbi:PHP domain protein [Thermosulfidibacter takaii ABI70S6]|uniref:PHP domain protein n=1 Tax=Thermosulfidibacter takaii (strain DSM 17441 / JCM 13301 / NBRC 103674 / ABI70S6) TaxID=1298851 RepID=A0A0S3QSH3_THET7|nr:histidinol phosphate phosphatase domain-containing protein [Thermosulfidibacter takaii]BAT71261.1 PHP domain protein [Thermosulfidibacter takaii ABI70S6]
MVDLHMHTVFSDGVLIPSELARRAEVKGLKYMAITDHGDFSNMEHIIPAVMKAAERINRAGGIKVIPGIEITHVPPQDIPDAVKLARSLGARIVVVHGETIVEPVAPGTNRAAIEAGVDILAHPGLISEEDVKLAAENGVALEISGRKGHSFTNGHVVALAKLHGATLVFDTDTHSPSDLMDLETAMKVLMGAGLDEREALEVINNGYRLARKILGEE